MTNSIREELKDLLCDFCSAKDLYPEGFLKDRTVLITGFEPGVIAFMIAKFMIEHGIDVINA